MIDYNEMTEEQLIQERAALLAERRKTIAELMTINGVKRMDLKIGDRVECIQGLNSKTVRISRGDRGTIVQVYSNESSLGCQISWGAHGVRDHYAHHLGTIFKMVTEVNNGK